MTTRPLPTRPAPDNLGGEASRHRMRLLDSTSGDAKARPKVWCGMSGTGTTGGSELVLQGNGFFLRPWRIADAESLATNADNRNVWTNLRARFPRPYTAAVARTWIARCIGGRERGLQLAIDVGGLAVGGLSVDLVTANAPRTGELGYWVGEAYWRRGIAGEAVRLASPLAFQRLALDRLRATVRSSNEPSLRILEREGFAVQSRMRRSDRRPGSAVVEIVYTKERAAIAETGKGSQNTPAESTGTAPSESAGTGLLARAGTGSVAHPQQPEGLESAGTAPIEREEDAPSPAIGGKANGPSRATLAPCPG